MLTERRRKSFRVDLGVAPSVTKKSSAVLTADEEVPAIFEYFTPLRPDSPLHVSKSTTHKSGTMTTRHTESCIKNLE